MPTAEPARLLSPNRRRIFTPDLDKPNVDITVKALHLAGWIVYNGPGQTDKRGWVIIGSDPEVDAERVRRTGRMDFRGAGGY